MRHELIYKNLVKLVESKMNIKIVNEVDFNIYNSYKPIGLDQFDDFAGFYIHSDLAPWMVDTKELIYISGSLDWSEKVGTLLHELGHATGHKSRLKRESVMEPKEYLFRKDMEREEQLSNAVAQLALKTLGLSVKDGRIKTILSDYRITKDATEAYMMLRECILNDLQLVIRLTDKAA